MVMRGVGRSQRRGLREKGPRVKRTKTAKTKGAKREHGQNGSAL